MGVTSAAATIASHFSTPKVSQMKEQIEMLIQPSIVCRCQLVLLLALVLLLVAATGTAAVASPAATRACSRRCCAVCGVGPTLLAQPRAAEITRER